MINSLPRCAIIFFCCSFTLCTNIKNGCQNATHGTKQAPSLTLGCFFFYYLLQPRSAKTKDFAHQSNLASKKCFLFAHDATSFQGKHLSSIESHGSYRPLVVLTFRLNFILHGFAPAGCVHALSVFSKDTLFLLYFPRFFWFKNVWENFCNFTCAKAFMCSLSH